MELARGAEAVCERTTEGVVKHRPVKGYRHPQLDKTLRISRTRAEARMLAKAATAGVRVPSVAVQSDDTLLLEDISGELVEKIFTPEIAREIGVAVGKLHAAHIIHGDLTTSNMIRGDEVVLIDFGLGYYSERIEDKAVDLHVFAESIQSRHYSCADDAMRQFVTGYVEHGSQAVLDRMQVVASRGRNKK